MTEIFLLMVMMAGASYFPRILPFLADSEAWSPYIKRLLRELPVAIVAAITIPGLLYNAEEGWLFRFDNIELLSAVPTTAVAFLTKNMMATILTGLSSLILLHFVVNYLRPGSG